MFEKYLSKRMTGLEICRDFVSHRQQSLYGEVERQDFRDLLTLTEILSLSKVRNGANGRQYRIDEMFKGERLYKALIHGATVMHISGDIFSIVDGNPRSPLEEPVNLKIIEEVFPRGLPRTRRHMVTWLHYISWAAREKYGYRR